MASNVWLDEAVRCCNAIDRETINSLNTIQARLGQTGFSMNRDFKIMFLKMINYRLMETYKRFEMVLSMEKSMNAIMFESTDKNDDVPMPDVTNRSHEERSHLNRPTPIDIADNTPFHVVNSPMNGVDLLHELLTPAPSVQSQKVFKVPMASMASMVPEVKMTKSKREWICFACKSEKLRNVSTFAFSTIDQLYEHWYAKHADSQYPFRFYSADLIQCNVGKCRYFSTFQGLERHHRKEHPSQIFVAVLNNQCALCHYDGADLNQHACGEMVKVLLLKLINPIRYTEEVLVELKAFNRSFECKHCGTTFDTSEEAMTHHREQHRELMIHTEKAKIHEIGVICGCCDTMIEVDMHARHLKSIVEKRWSNLNTWNTWFQQFEMDFLKSKVVFSNGLVVFKQNLIATETYKNYEPAYKTLGQNLFNTLQRCNALKRE